MSSLWETLLEPDREERKMRDRLIVIDAANRLQVGEFQFLQLAYREWFNHDLPEALVARLFASYMLHHEVPHWARHYARSIIDGCENGLIDDNAPRFHRYDYDYHISVPQGIQRFCVAAVCVFLAVFGSIYVADKMVKSPMSMLPPYFDREEFRRGSQDSRADSSANVRAVAPRDGEAGGPNAGRR